MCARRGVPVSERELTPIRAKCRRECFALCTSCSTRETPFLAFSLRLLLSRRVLQFPLRSPLPGAAFRHKSLSDELPTWFNQLIAAAPFSWLTLHCAFAGQQVESAFKAAFSSKSENESWYANLFPPLFKNELFKYKNACHYLLVIKCFQLLVYRWCVFPKAGLTISRHQHQVASAIGTVENGKVRGCCVRIFGFILWPHRIRLALRYTLAENSENSSRLLQSPRPHACDVNLICWSSQQQVGVGLCSLCRQRKWVFLPYNYLHSSSAASVFDAQKLNLCWRRNNY